MILAAREHPVSPVREARPARRFAEHAGPLRYGSEVVQPDVDLHAAGLRDVAEILEVDALVRMSLCPPWIVGLCPYHREVVPVVSLTCAPWVRSSGSR